MSVKIVKSNFKIEEMKVVGGLKKGLKGMRVGG